MKNPWSLTTAETEVTDPRESRQPETFFSRGGRLPLSAWAQAVTGSRG